MCKEMYHEELANMFMEANKSHDLSLAKLKI